MSNDCCSVNKKKSFFHWENILLLSIVIFYLLSLFIVEKGETSKTFFSSINFFVQELFWGVIIGGIFMYLFRILPRQSLQSIVGLGQSGYKATFKAILAGFVLDVCSHGILFIGIGLYRQGLRLPQLIAFLLSSPWNSISLTFVLISLIGEFWTILFVFLSMLIAFVSATIFEFLMNNKLLVVQNDNKEVLSIRESKILNVNFSFKTSFNWQILVLVWKDIRLLLKWLVIGVYFSVLMRLIFSIDGLGEVFSASIGGLLFTLMLAIIIEVCSEGSVPFASDLFLVAPGNAFAFLLAGVATDYTEILALKESTKSWRVALFLPLVTVPQVLLVSYMMNIYST